MIGVRSLPISRRRMVLLAMTVCYCLLAALSRGNQSATTDEHHNDHSFESVLKRVIRASRERFRPVQTFRIDNYPNGDYWYEVDHPLPGATLCRVFEHPELIYQCEWTSSKKTPKIPTFVELADQMERSLGASWTRTNREMGRIVLFEPKNRREGVVEVRSRDRAGRSLLHIIIHRPVE
jgi:hypothetical protein